METRLYWDNDPKLELMIYNRDVKNTIIYRTIGINSNDKLFQNAHTMYIRYVYGFDQNRNRTENFYYFDNGYKKWIEFDPKGIGWNAEEATEIATYAIGGTAVLVGGIVLLESGAVVTLIREGAKKLLVNNLKEVLANSSLDALNQYIITGGDFEKIDWANVAASGLIKDKHLKNIVASAIDYTIEKKLNHVFGEDSNKKDIEDATVEFIIRTGADALFEEFKRPNSKEWNEKAGTDLLKKLVRKYVKEVYEEHFKQTDSTPEL